MAVTEGQKIWDAFKRVALYKDLKELYNKCLPPINTFEDRLSMFHTELEQMKSIMTRFDELILTKSDKAQLKKAKERFAKEYIQKNVNDEFVSDTV